MVVHDLRTPPGPRRRSVVHGLKNALAFQRGGLAYVEDLWKRYGDIVRVQVVNQSALLLFHPAYARQVLQQGELYDKHSVPIETLQALFGNGLFTVYGDGWRRQRQMVQPVFSHKHVHVLAALISESVDEYVSAWSMAEHEGDVLDMGAQMANLTMRTIARTLFSFEARDELGVIEQRMKALLSRDLSSYVLLPFPPLSVPIGRNRRIKETIGAFDHVIYSMIEAYRGRSTETDDLFSMLLGARNERGEPISDEQIRGEVMTMLLGGQETTSNTLTWIWYALATQQEVEEKVQRELDQVLGSQPPSVEKLGQLPYLDMVIKEALRLYPASFVLARQSERQDQIDGFAVERNTLMCIMPYFIHRHPDFWSEPERFRPERFSPEAVRGRDKFAYIPFGGGPRTCVAMHFAETFMKLTVATIAQRYRVRILPGARVEPTVQLTTMSPSSLPVVLQERV